MDIEQEKWQANYTIALQLRDCGFVLMGNKSIYDPCLVYLFESNATKDDHEQNDISYWPDGTVTVQFIHPDNGSYDYTTNVANDFESIITFCELMDGRLRGSID